MLEAFYGLYGDAVRPGPAPATDVEKAVHAALHPDTPAHSADPPSEPAQPTTRTVPAYAAGPEDHEALPQGLFSRRSEWEKHRTRDDTTVAQHESMVLRAESTHEADPRDTAWTSRSTSPLSASAYGTPPPTPR